MVYYLENQLIKSKLLLHHLTMVTKKMMELNGTLDQQLLTSLTKEKIVHQLVLLVEKTANVYHLVMLLDVLKTYKIN
jgi:hypothetical protein